MASFAEFLKTQGTTPATVGSDVCAHTAAAYLEIPIDGKPTPALAKSLQAYLNDAHGYKDKEASACNRHILAMYAAIAKLVSGASVTVSGVEYKLVRVTPDGENNPNVTAPANTPTQGGNAPSPRRN